MTSDDTGEQLLLEHTFTAERDRLWAAFTDPRQLARWFGPRGWSVDPESIEIDLRVGGFQRFTMSDDTNPTMVSSVTARFVEIVPRSRLVGTETVFGSGSTDSLGMTLAITLSDVRDGTLLRIEQGPFPAGVVALGREGWISSFGRLEQLLAEE